MDNARFYYFDSFFFLRIVFGIFDITFYFYYLKSKF